MAYQRTHPSPEIQLWEQVNRGIASPIPIAVAFYRSALKSLSSPCWASCSAGCWILELLLDAGASGSGSLDHSPGTSLSLPCPAAPCLFFPASHGITGCCWQCQQGHRFGVESAVTVLGSESNQKLLFRGTLQISACANQIICLFKCSFHLFPLNCHIYFL